MATASTRATRRESRAGPQDEHHRDVQGGAARAAVFGASDGLLTNVAIILGVAAANPPSGFVRLSGLAALLGGAFSMAAGEYVSMKAQVELVEREVAVEREALEKNPEAEYLELVSMYVGHGMPRDAAETVAKTVMKNPELALEIHSREEFGVAPGQGGNPRAAAVSSFVSFSVGALIPLIPWFFFGGTAAAVGSIILGAAATLTVGGLVGHFTGRSPVRAAARQLGIAIFVTAVTFAVGHLLGVQTS